MTSAGTQAEEKRKGSSAASATTEHAAGLGAPPSGEVGRAAREMTRTHDGPAPAEVQSSMAEAGSGVLCATCLAHWHAHAAAMAGHAMELLL